MVPACRRLLALAALLCGAFLAVPALAQNHIEAELVIEQPASPGQPVDIAIHFTPEKNWHGYWLNPGDAGYGMELDWKLPEGWSVGEIRYPVPETFVVAGLMNHVYAREYAVLTMLTAAQGAQSGTAYPIAVDAQWLACDDKTCVPERATLATQVPVASDRIVDERFDMWRAAIPPLIDSVASFSIEGERIRIAIPLPASLAIAEPHLFIAEDGFVNYNAVQNFWRDGDRLVVELERKQGGGEPVRLSGIISFDDAGNGVQFVAEPGEVAPGGTPLAGAAAPELPPLWSLLLAALAGGLLLNIMPCVFPILSLKALTLARAGESEAMARKEAVAYTGGVVAATLALGGLLLVLRAAGNEVGWAFQLQEPGVVVALLVLAVAITANLAGLYELPTLAITRAGGTSSAFSTGLLASFVATPCTGPFMAAAMGAALLLPTLSALLLFGVLGLGLALPFLALGFVPRLRALLPRPGNWMNTFRKVLAVPMGLIALALFWLAYRLGGTGFMALAIGIAVAVLVVLWAVGKTQHAGKSALPLVAVAVPALALAAVLLLPRLYEPPQVQGESLLAVQPFSAQALAEARAAGKPVFLWFTADWCLTCKVNESIAIEREATREAFERAGVVPMVGDWTQRDPQITRFLTAHGAAGVPLYLWYPPGGEAEQLPQVLTPESLTVLAGSLPAAN